MTRFQLAFGSLVKYIIVNITDPVNISSNYPKAHTRTVDEWKENIDGTDNMPGMHREHI